MSGLKSWTIFASEPARHRIGLLIASLMLTWTTPLPAREPNSEFLAGLRTIVLMCRVDVAEAELSNSAALRELRYGSDASLGDARSFPTLLPPDMKPGEWCPVLREKLQTNLESSTLVVTLDGVSFHTRPDAAYFALLVRLTRPLNPAPVATEWLAIAEIVSWRDNLPPVRWPHDIRMARFVRITGAGGHPLSSAISEWALTEADQLFRSAKRGPRAAPVEPPTKSRPKLLDEPTGPHRLSGSWGTVNPLSGVHSVALTCQLNSARAQKASGRRPDNPCAEITATASWLAKRSNLPFGIIEWAARPPVGGQLAIGVAVRSNDSACAYAGGFCASTRFLRLDIPPNVLAGELLRLTSAPRLIPLARRQDGNTADRWWQVFQVYGQSVFDLIAK